MFHILWQNLVHVYVIAVSYTHLCLLPACRLEDVFAFDTGPGNMVMDAVYTQLTGGEKIFDEGGAYAVSYTHLIENWNLVGDQVIALNGALSGEAGIALIAGTGSICFGKNGARCV